MRKPRYFQPLFDLAGMLQVRFATGNTRSRGSGCRSRVLIALVIAGFAIVQFYSGTSEEVNAFTGRKQRLALSTEQEVQLGLASRSEMSDMYGGLSADVEARTRVNQIGRKLVDASDADETDYRFDFHLLGDRRTVNAFALPGGQIFITEALYRLLETDDELAGVLGHEIGHVVGRHSSEQIGKQKLLNGLTMAAILATSDGQGQGNAQLAQLVNQVVSTKYGRDDEIESDMLGVKFLMQSGYEPEALLRVMEVLKQAGGSGGAPEFLSTHPAPENRSQLIKAEIERLKQEGVR